MIPGVDLNSRYVQAGIVVGLGATAVGLACLAKGSETYEAEHPHGCCGCSSISSAAEPVFEIDTTPVEIQEEKTLLTRLGSLAKAVFLLPIVFFVSALKALFSALSFILEKNKSI